MSRRKISPFIPIGLLMMSSALLWHNFMRDRLSDFAVGLLMGVGLGMMVVGFIRQRRCRLEAGKGSGSISQ